MGGHILGVKKAESVEQTWRGSFFMGIWFLPKRDSHSFLCSYRFTVRHPPFVCCYLATSMTRFFLLLLFFTPQLLFLFFSLLRRSSSHFRLLNSNWIENKCKSFLKLNICFQKNLVIWQFSSSNDFRGKVETWQVQIIINTDLPNFSPISRFFNLKFQRQKAQNQITSFKHN